MNAGTRIPLRPRRSRLAAALLFLGAGFTLGAPRPSYPALADPPNILWIACPDLSPDLGCYGDDEARTPNLDRLAGQGARYARAFSVAPADGPSRSAILTGMFPPAIGTQNTGVQAVPPPTVKCFTETLRAAGYYCVNHAAEKIDSGFDAPLTAWDADGPKAHWRGREKGQPFFAVFNLTATRERHLRATAEEVAPVLARLRPQDRHDPARVKVPPYYPDTPAVRRDLARYADLVAAADVQVQDVLDQLKQDGLEEETIVFFFGEQGRALPRAKRWVYDSGTRVPLLIRWPGKIRPMTVRDEVVSLIDFPPTALAFAGVKPPKGLHGQIFVGRDADAPRQYAVSCRDRCDEASDSIRAARDQKYRYIRNLQPARPYALYVDPVDQLGSMRDMRRMNAEGTLTGPQRLFFAPEKPEEELYDLEADPHEVNNLAGKSEHQAVLRRLRGALEKWMKDTDDPGAVKESELLEKARPGGKWAETTPPTISIKRQSGQATVTLTCATEGASLAYATEMGPEAHWKLYTRPVKLPQQGILRARACRIGYKDSPEIQRSLDAPD